ncbi:DUF3429 domain-containing protein [Oricola cellulosilytica]|uniref:DUF3429 domain-containing protein n=1 Tax=Oricola cellulosilytica TaxID=1429082 RepID=A0A4R0PFW6_9HYPH|nr:DUF3429 domain-containing protein [Oricola cellulosilytica]TCD16541.1 DUF3429 domain-containing protein [Oricola cellulosilytica]
MMITLRKRRTARRGLEWTAVFLALSGFLPFAFLTALLLAAPGFIAAGESSFSEGTSAAVALKAYAAIILSFLGGIRWGVAIVSPGEGRDNAEVLTVSVIPSLVGWFAFFLGDPWSFAVFAAAFAATGLWDRRLVTSGGAPAWFGRLRLLLTILVTGTMLTAFAATF